MAFSRKNSVSSSPLGELREVTVNERNADISIAKGSGAIPKSKANHNEKNKKVSNHAGKFKRANIVLNEGSDIRTLPELVEYNATHNAKYPFCIQALKSSGAGEPEFLTVSHLQLKVAILRCSTWILSNLPALGLPVKSGDSYVKGPPVALFMESDVGLFIFELSLISLGVPVLLLSAKLSPKAIQKLLKDTAAQSIIVSSRLSKTLHQAISLSSGSGFEPSVVPRCPFQDFLIGDPQDDMVARKIFHPGYHIDENDRNVFILHSSGTTGLPKPIYNSHKYLLSFSTCHEIPESNKGEGRCVSTLPLYHGFGLVCPALSMGIGMTTCFPPPTTIPTGQSVVNLIKNTRAKFLVSVPSILEEIALSGPEEVESVLAPLQFVAFGGGPLKSSVGENLKIKGVRLLNHYGSTETGPITPLFIPKADYDHHYFRLRKDTNIRIEKAETAVDGTQQYKLVAHPFGWSEVFEIKDQLVASPMNPTSDFNTAGRSDDVLVLANGEKALPGILENKISARPDVKAAVAFGEAHAEIGLLVQPFQQLHGEDLVQFKANVWLDIQKANELMDAHARISSPEAVLFVSYDTILPRSDKGSILRREVYQSFESEISKHYLDLEKISCLDTADILSSADLPQALKALIEGQLDWKTPPTDWGFDDDLFELGLDSLQATKLRRVLLSSLPSTLGSRSTSEVIGRDFIYNHPSVTKLSTAILNPDSNIIEQPENLQSIDHFVEQYSFKTPRATGQKKTILLTGATGSLGGHTLVHFLKQEDVSSVVCLNRAPSGNSPRNSRERLAKSLEKKKLYLSDEDWSKVEVLQTHSHLPHLGLDDQTYHRLCNEVTHVIHSAWAMDFHRNLGSFESQFQILQNLLEFSRSAHVQRPWMRTRFVFISSIAVVGQYPLVKGRTSVPEAPLDDHECANSIGYGRAKLVCEKILENTAKSFSSQIEVSSVRVGQLAGSTDSGYWNYSEHIAALFKSSIFVKAFPQITGTLSWIPVNEAAAALSEILFSEEPLKQVYHLENPQRQAWSDVLSIWAATINSQNPAILPFDEWLDRIAKSESSPEHLNPVTKLIEFFENDFRHMACGNIVLGLREAVAVSPTLQRMSIVGEDSVAKYAKYWSQGDY